MKSKLAIWSFVLTILGVLLSIFAFPFIDNVEYSLFKTIAGLLFILGPIFWVSGFVMANKSLKLIKDQKFEGKWFAIISLSISYIIVLYFILAFIYLVFINPEPFMPLI